MHERYKRKDSIYYALVVSALSQPNAKNIYNYSNNSEKCSTTMK